jgi:methylthioribose-1-phosphate isomerase
MNIPSALRFDGHLHLLDQRKLPEREEWILCTRPGQVVDAIGHLAVRGAPAIGVAAGYGLALTDGDLPAVEAEAVRLVNSRPTAVNLRWAVNRVLQAARRATPGALAAAMLAEAAAIHREDQAACRRIGELGLSLLPEHPRILTHCNAGALATSGIGTALAPVYLAAEAGRDPQVFACEARPVMQGARLTTWELSRAGVDVTLLVDAAAAFLISQGKVDLVIVGADRIARNGDVANKVGTYGLAVAAERSKVPFYVAAPTSTFDAAASDGSAIPIEHRAAGELSERFVGQVSASGIKVWAPAFDITPAALVSAYVTEREILPGGRGLSS